MQFWQFKMEFKKLFKFNLSSWCENITLTIKVELIEHVIIFFCLREVLRIILDVKQQ